MLYATDIEFVLEVAECRNGHSARTEWQRLILAPVETPACMLKIDLN
jgi:hypothetical protein